MYTYVYSDQETIMLLSDTVDFIDKYFETFVKECDKIGDRINRSGFSFKFILFFRRMHRLSGYLFG